MKQIILPLLFTFLLVNEITAQITFIAQTTDRARMAQIANGEFVYYSYSNDTVKVTDLNTLATTQIHIPQIGSNSVIIYHLSRNVFDQDNGIEFLIAYYTNGNSDSIGIVDNGAIVPFTQVPTNQFGYQPEFMNTPSGSFLRLEANDGMTTQTFFYSLPGQALLTRELPIETVLSDVFPNPSNEIIRTPAIPGEQISIHALDGRHVKDVRIDNYNQEIDVNDFTPGSYLIRSNSGTSWKFVKN